MRIGNVGNYDNVSFGSFRVFLPSEKIERDTFELISKEIRKTYPETQIIHEKSHYLPGFVKRLAYSIFNVTGKDENVEHNLATTFSLAGFQLLETERTAAQRAEASLFALTKPVIMLKENALDIKA